MDDIVPPFQLESDQLAFKGKVLIDQSTFDLVGWSLVGLSNLYMFEHHASSCRPMQAIDDWRVYSFWPTTTITTHIGNMGMYENMHARERQSLRLDHNLPMAKIYNYGHSHIFVIPTSGWNVKPTDSLTHW